jgi:hypothetical protein
MFPEAVVACQGGFGSSFGVLTGGASWWRKNPSVFRFWPLAATSLRGDLAAISPYCMELEAPVAASTVCDPHYPDVYVPVYPPDVNGGDLPFTNIRTLQPDPHGLDGNSDGVGCES